MKYNHLKVRRLQIPLETNHLRGHSVRTSRYQSKFVKLSNKQHIQQEACLWEVKHGAAANPLIGTPLSTDPKNTKHSLT